MEEYNWNLILKVSIPLALIEAIIFYTSLGSAWKWSALTIGLFLAAMLVYMNDRRKSNIFNAVGIVLLAALITKFLRDFGII